MRFMKACSIPGDIPVKILNEFLPELTAPIVDPGHNPNKFKFDTATPPYHDPYI
jgi:hypothetical protein